MLLIQLPGDCLLTGLCVVQQYAGGPPPGLLFLAIGVVLAGGLGLVRARKSKTGDSE